MDVDTLKLFWNAGITVILLLLGWLWNSLHKRIDAVDYTHQNALAHSEKNRDKELNAILVMQSKLHETLTNVQINYVHKDELKEMRKEFLERFDRLETLLRRNSDS